MINLITDLYWDIALSVVLMTVGSAWKAWRKKL